MRRMGAGKSLYWIPLGSSRCASGRAKSGRSVNGSLLNTSLAIWDLCQPASEILRSGGAPPEFALEGLKVTPHPSLAMLPLGRRYPCPRTYTGYHRRPVAPTSLRACPAPRSGFTGPLGQGPCRSLYGGASPLKSTWRDLDSS